MSSYLIRYVHLPILVTSSKPAFCQFWLLLTPPNVATFGVPLDNTKCGYFCTPPNVATFGAPKDITKCGYFRTPPNVATFGVPLDITKCGCYRTPPNVATFGVPLDITKCGYFCQMWQNLEYPWILPNVATSKCGKIWSTHGYATSDSTKCGNIWSTHGYYQMWLLLTPPNVATFGVPMDINYHF